MQVRPLSRLHLTRSHLVRSHLVRSHLVRSHLVRSLSLGVLCAAAASAGANPQRPAVVEEVVSYGRAVELIGQVHTASEGVVGYDDIALPPLLRVGELVESVPGMVATQHSGTGKANQYFLRGFNLDHGTDFAVALDGMPLNMPTHGHGQGYLDLNPIIPELVREAYYRKGPYAAETGDFASAGSVGFSLYDRLDRPEATVTLGSHDYRRALVAGSADTGSGVLTAAVDATRYDGPWRKPENLEQNRALLRYVRNTGAVRQALTLTGYSGDWDSTDQVPRRAILDGTIPRLGFVDPNLGGATDFVALIGNVEAETWALDLWTSRYDFRLYSNFTYLLDDPADGDGFEQRDQRSVYGGRLTGTRPALAGMTPLTLRWGTELRHDDIGKVGLYRVSVRARRDTVRADSVAQTTAAGWLAADYAFTTDLRATLGVRVDHLRFDVDADLPDNGGSGNATLGSLRGGLAYRFTDALEGYASWGQGHHSNDVRGATIRFDPASGDPVDRVDPLVRSTGAELGLRYQAGPSFNTTLALYRLDLDSELVFVGDAGGTEANDATRRTGIELAGFWTPVDRLALNMALGYVDAGFRAPVEGGGREIPGAVARTATAGAIVRLADGLTASMRVRYLGPAPLVEDRSVRSRPSTLVNAGLDYRRGPLGLRLDAFNLFDSSANDIAYYYASRLAGEPEEGVEDIHLHPLEPRSLRASLSWHW